MAHLLNRDRLIETLFFKEYPPLNSYYAGGIYENPNNPKMPYDPQRALQLLERRGMEEPGPSGQADERRHSRWYSSSSIRTRVRSAG